MSFRRMFTNPITQKFYQAGEILKLPRLGKTLRTIANDEDAFYKGKLAQTLLKELCRLKSKNGTNHSYFERRR